MNIVKINDFKEIYNNEEIVELVSLCLFNPSLGKVQSLAQSLYSKNQGVFYKAVLNDEIIGIIGGKVIDGCKLELHHLAVKKSFRLMGTAKTMIKSIIELEEVDQVFCEVDHKIVNFFKKCGFSASLIEDEFLGSETYYCTL